MRHSAAHLLAQAVTELYPTTKLTIGPVTDEGFFYDFLPEKNFKEEDLAIIEAKMHEIAKRNLPIIQKSIAKQEALKLFKDNPFKIELINDIPDRKWDFLARVIFVIYAKAAMLNQPAKSSISNS